MATPVPHPLKARVHGSSLRPLLLALVALALLTATSWGLAHLDLGVAGTPVALAIAAVKASVVALVFMEIAQASVAAKVAAMTTIAFIVLLCFGLAADVAFR